MIDWIWWRLGLITRFVCFCLCWCGWEGTFEHSVTTRKKIWQILRNSNHHHVPFSRWRNFFPVSDQLHRFGIPWNNELIKPYNDWQSCGLFGSFGVFSLVLFLVGHKVIIFLITQKHTYCDFFWFVGIFICLMIN